ncbi:MAG: D-2-hydroxyacid dehydrogenase [Acidobacteriota bacterium]
MGRRVLLILLAAAALPAQQKKILVTGLDEASVQELRSAAPDAAILAATPAQLESQVVDADAILGTITPKLVRAGKKLKWVQIYSAGAEGALSPELRASGITLTNCKIIQGPNIADHAMALLLSLTRGLYQTIPGRTSEEWTRGRHRLVELQGKTAVIIGLGGIGMQIAQRAHAFGMRIIGVDPKDMPYAAFVSRLVPPDRLDSVLPEADVVFVSAPHTKESEGMMGPRQFELMKPNGYFIAVSRGKLYSTEALMKALDSKRLAGAGLDVTDPEPLPKGHALWKFENVVITPHTAGGSDLVQGRRLALLKENVRRFANGEPLLNVVDKQKGY